MMVYVTFKNKAEAQKICTSVVKKKLAACANIFPNHTAIYEWSGKMHGHKETAAILKTQKSISARLIQEIKKQHSYQTPCIVLWKIAQGDPDYMSWIKKQTGSL